MIHKYVGSNVPAVGAVGEPQMLAIPGTTEGSLEYQLGAKIPELLQGKQTLKAIPEWIERTDANPLRSGMMGGAAGAGLGALLSVLLQKDPRLGAMLGAGALGGGSWLAGTLMNMKRKQLAKQASFYGNSGSSPESFISNKIALDSGLSFNEKTQLSGLIGQLSDGQTGELAKLLRTITGAGVGLVIAKYLLKLGLGGTILSTIIGGAIGSRMGGKSLSRDVFGNARLIQ